jgi:hypothetical protein
MDWFEHPVRVPFGNTAYDTSLGGSHDLTIACPPNTPITQLAPGIISDISAPGWGKQVCVKLYTPIHGHAYFATLHLSAVEPGLKVGAVLTAGQLIGWAGGATMEQEYLGTQNPTGQNFLDSPVMSSQVQVGIALCDGPAYGGLGWAHFPPIDHTLDPTPILQAAIAAAHVAASAPDPAKVARDALIDEAVAWLLSKR